MTFGPRGAGEEMPLEQQPVAQADEFVLEFQSYHQALSAVFSERGVETFGAVERLTEMLPDAGGVFYEMFILDHVEHRQSRRAGEMVAPEGGTEHPVFRLDDRRNQHSAYGGSRWPCPWRWL